MNMPLTLLRAMSVAVYVCGVVMTTDAQIKPQSRTDRTQKTPGGTLEQLLNPQTQPDTEIPTIPVEETIDPATYIVGPNDWFYVGLWGGTNLSFPLLVSSEGTLLVPEIGEFHVGGKTLQQVKEEVSRSIKQNVTVAAPTVTLFVAREIVVTVMGSVSNQGPLILSAAYRVDKAVALAKPSVAQDGTPMGSRRHIILRRRGNDRDQLIDLERFFVTREHRLNPFLQEGDVIIVPQRNVDENSVSVYGAVNKQGQYEYREDDSLLVMIQIAQGFASNADPANIELTRLSQDGTSSVSRVINVQGIIDGAAPDIPLQLGDRIVVREKVNHRADYKVQLRGEVLYPGIYPITLDGTRLSEIIQRAGGFTQFAYLPAAEVFRRRGSPEAGYVAVPQEAQLNLRMNDQIVTPEQRSYYELEASIQRGNVSVDFVKLFERQDTTQDVTLRDGDVVFIPNNSLSVYVYGQVGRPGFVPHQAGADLRYYIQRAGGYGEEAEAGGARVIKAKTREWLHPSDTVIEPGDYVWVPKDIKYPTGYYLNMISQAASIISVVLSMTLIIIQLTDKQ